MTIEIIPVEGIPIVQPGDNIAAFIAECLPVEDDDILCVASSVYSKSKGYLRLLEDIQPSERASEIAEKCGEDPRFIQAVLDEADDIIIDYPFILCSLPHGHVGVRAGIDHSNVEDGRIIVLPPNPMTAADEIRDEIQKITGKEIRVILTDTCGRSFRRGQTGVAIGWSGMPAIQDYRGDKDLFGHTLEITEEAVVDEIAGIVNFVMGESNRGVPAVICRNMPHWEGHDNLYFDAKEDITRTAMKNNY